MNKKFQISPKRPKGEDGYKTFSIRVKDETVSELDRIANATGRSRNEIIGLMLEYAIQNCEITPDPSQNAQ